MSAWQMLGDFKVRGELEHVVVLGEAAVRRTAVAGYDGVVSTALQILCTKGSAMILILLFLLPSDLCLLPQGV
jgi:hypothetical protein